MTRIWYSVLGDGMGHAIRSDTIIEELLKKHDLIITATKKAYRFLKKKYGNIVYEIEGQELVHEDNAVNIGDSVINYFRDFPFKLRKNTKNILSLINDFKPDIVISDFEPASHYFGAIFNIPCISIDNVHVLSECKVKLLPGTNMELKRAHLLLRFLHLKSDYYILPAFADVTPKNPKKTIIVDPIIRKSVRKLKPQTGDFVLVYQTTATNTKMLPVLKKSKNKFVIYGMGKKKDSKNLKFKEFNETTFLEDLRKAKFVIVNGGFTVISEALFLKKPIFAIPIENQLEQEFNGFSLRDRGFGDYSSKITQQNLEKFNHLLPFYRKNLAKQKKWNHKKIFDVLEKIIPKLKRNKKPKYDLLKLVVARRKK